MNNLSNTLKTELQQNWVILSFTKRNGDQRTMLCTTNLALIPQEHHPKQNEYYTPVEDNREDTLYKVYEENNGWRSFSESQLIEWHAV